MATSSDSTTNNALTFSAADFQKWNQTTSQVILPAKLVGQAKIPQLRSELIKSIGEKKVSAVQALSPTKYRIQFSSSSARHVAETNGINFRQLTLIPTPAYEEIKSVFVDRAPLQMPDNYLFELLAPYGRVLSVQHLKVRGFRDIKSGTRRVSMVIDQSIPAVLKIGTFQLSFRYRGQPPTCFVCQEMGHAGKDCPRSRKRRASSVTGNTDTKRSASPSVVSDLRVKLTPKKPDQDSKAPALPPSSSKTAETQLPKDVATTSRPLPSNGADLRHKLAPAKATTKTTGTKHNTDPVVVVDLPPTDLRHKLRESKPSTDPDPDPVVAADMDHQSASMSLTASQAADAVAMLRQVFPSQASSTPTPAQSLDLTTLTAMAQSVAGSNSSALPLKQAAFRLVVNGVPSGAPPAQARVPRAVTFDFSMTPGANSQFTQWSGTQNPGSAKELREPGCKGLKPELDEDDLPLRVRWKRRRHGSSDEQPQPEPDLVLCKLDATASDTVDDCLRGESVVDPIAPVADDLLTDSPADEMETSSTPTVVAAAASALVPDISSNTDIVVQDVAPPHSPEVQTSFAALSPVDALPTNTLDSDPDISRDVESPPALPAPETSSTATVLDDGSPLSPEFPIFEDPGAPVSAGGTSLDMLPSPDVGLSQDLISPAPRATVAGASVDSDSDEPASSHAQHYGDRELQFMFTELPVLSFEDHVF